jgi:hypothetical protein
MMKRGKSESVELLPVVGRRARDYGVEQSSNLLIHTM